MQDFKCRKCGSVRFFWMGYVDEEDDDDSETVKSSQETKLGYKCSVCNERHQICVLEDR